MAETLIGLAEAEHQKEKDSKGSSHDVLAMATHRRHGTDLWVIGSVNDHILVGSHLPLLVVR